MTTALLVGCGNSNNEFVFTGTSRVLTSVDVQPATATATVGQSQQFVLQATFSDGTTATATQLSDQIAWDSDNEAVATIDQNGLATAISPGTTTITGTLSTAQGAFSDTAVLTVTAAVNQNPQVNLDDSDLAYTRGSGSTAAFPNASVTDDQANLANGTLTISLTGDNTGVDLTAPATPDIGTVTDDDVNDTITVALDDNATPANIQAFLQAVGFQADNTATFGARTLNVTLTDGQGGTGSDSRTVFVQGASAQNVTVAPSGADFTTIQAAVNSVAAQTNGQGSVITVVSGDFTTDGTGNDGIIVISNDADLEGLQLRGANAGVSAGINPGTRGAETVVNAFEIDNQVVIDGFQVNGGATTLASGDDQGFALNDEASNTVIRNNVVDYTGALSGSRGVLTITSADPSNITIEFNHFQGWTSAAFLQGTVGAVPVR
ncbi:MAG: Ig-like domain-containing protein, partial [Candidatus Eremiobacteraeota bacterium]|nr:Ig-like domain-containing protein [Candidatus Eremiobacteraeota bacterium]